MFSRKYKKQNKLIKFILKFFNLYAYEKETLNMVNPDYKNVGKNFIKFNDTSFNLSKGYTRLSRKIKKLDIFYRNSPNNNLWKKDFEKCCDLRKVKPLDKVLKNYDAWISGRKSYQGGERKDLRPFESNNGKIVVNPLANFGQKFVANMDDLFANIW